MLPIAAIGPGTGSIVVVALIVLAVVYYLVSTIVALRKTDRQTLACHPVRSAP